MSRRVYGWATNPTIDPFSFKLSNDRAEALVRSRAGDFITLPCGRLAIQLRSTPPQFTPLHADFADSPSIYPTFGEAWGIRPSDGYPVWQMRTKHVESC